MITTTVEIPLDDIISQLDRQDALELIKQIDSNMAEVDFTVKVLKMLVDSLKNDEPEDDIRKWIGL
jgi:hypothetical protein